MPNSCGESREQTLPDGVDMAAGLVHALRQLLDIGIGEAFILAYRHGKARGSLKALQCCRLDQRRTRAGRQRAVVGINLGQCKYGAE
jgi:hypothetical protein